MEKQTSGSSALEKTDKEIFDIIEKQKEYERSTLKMIASENFVSSAVLEATGSILMNKYAEGYPGTRYYEGNLYIDEIEKTAIDRLKKIFGAEHANVQSYSGSPANAAVYRATVLAGDKVMGMPVTEGGHLTHGWPVNFSGADYTRIPYGVSLETETVDYDKMRDIALKERPKLIWVGGTAYPRLWDYAAAASIAAEVDAYLAADIAHVAGLIAAGAHPNPVQYADVVASTSHKTIRGPRGGFLMSKIEDRYQQKYHSQTKHNLAKRIDRAVFPGLQGGPHMNQIAGLAVALKEASADSFKAYGKQIVLNAKALANHLLGLGYKLVSGGTDNHMLILNFKEKDFSGKDASQALAAAGIIANFNQVPGDIRKPTVTSGVRLGAAALTSMGMKEPEMKIVGDFIDTILKNIKDQAMLSGKIRQATREFALSFTPPGYD